VVDPLRTLQGHQAVSARENNHRARMQDQRFDFARVILSLLGT
jgi:hypothetical protein